MKGEEQVEGVEEVDAVIPETYEPIYSIRNMVKDFNILVKNF